MGLRSCFLPAGRLHFYSKLERLLMGLHVIDSGMRESNMISDF